MKIVIDLPRLERKAVVFDLVIGSIWNIIKEYKLKGAKVEYET